MCKLYSAKVIPCMQHCFKCVLGQELCTIYLSKFKSCTHCNLSKQYLYKYQYYVLNLCSSGFADQE